MAPAPVVGALRYELACRHASRRVRGDVVTRPGRDGRGLSRARHPARSRRRHQGAARRVRAAIRIGSRASSAKRKLLASLNHPNIAQIYGLEDSGTASARSSWSWSRADACRSHRQGPMPLDEALPIARADRRRARSRARAGHHPSRSEAGEHQGAARRHGEGARLRPGQGDRSDAASSTSPAR